MQNINEIFENKHSTYPPHMLKKRLINEGLIDEKCNLCNWD